MGATLLGVCSVGTHPRGRDARLLDDAWLVDAGVRMARRCAISEAQGRADEAARDDYRVREGRAGDGGSQRARVRSVQTLQLRLRSEELRARFQQRWVD